MTKLKSTLAIDTEATDLTHRRWAQPFMVSTCDPKGQQLLWEWEVDPYSRQPIIPKNDIRELRELTEDPSTELIFHNAVYDVAMLRRVGVDVNRHRPKWEGIQDTMLLAHVVNSQHPRGLKTLAITYLEILDDDEKRLSEVVNAARRRAPKAWKIGDSKHCDYWLPAALYRHDPKALSRDEAEACKVYNLRDSERTMLLWIAFQRFLSESDPHNSEWHYSREQELLRVINAIQERGVILDIPELNRSLAYYNTRCNQLENKCATIARRAGVPDLNLNSPPQLGTVLSQLNVKPTRLTPTGNIGTAAADLENMLEKFPPDSTLPPVTFLTSLLDYRTNNTARGYLSSYREHSYVDLTTRQRILHSSFNQTGTDTTRFSSSNPNLQNVSKEEDTPLRAVFRPRPHHRWYSFDYDQIELRIFAKLANETRMLDWFAAGVDIHYETGRLFFGDARNDKEYKLIRRAGKTINFAILYGASEYKITLYTSHVAGLSRRQSSGLSGYDVYKKQFPNAAKFMIETMNAAKREGLVQTAHGYPLRVSPERPYVGTNYKVQGTAGGIIKRAMIDTYNYLETLPRTEEKDLQAYPVLTIHDELIFEIRKGFDTPELLDTIGHLMQKAGEEVSIHTPVSCSRINKRWSLKEDVKLHPYKATQPSGSTVPV